MRAGEAGADVILFSESETCGQWVTVRIIRLRLHEPAADNKHARLLAELLTAKESTPEPADDAPEDHADRRMAAPARQRQRTGDEDCLVDCQDDCKSGPPFLFGNALGECLRGCRRRCGFR